MKTPFQGASRLAVGVGVGVLCVALAHAGADFPLGAGPRGLDDWRPALAGGNAVKVSVQAPSDPTSGRLIVTFEKAGPERRMVALSRSVTRDLTGLQALELDCSAELAPGLTVLPAVLFFEKSGGVWVKLSAGAPLPPPPGGRLRLPLKSLRQAAFSRDASGKIEWNAIDRVWLGFVVDGTGKGRVSISGIRVTDRPYRPVGPASLLPDGPLAWSVGHDPAVKASIETDVPGPGGRKCSRLDFNFPGGRHMYVVPSHPIRPLELGAYKGIRLTYKAKLPKGIGGLLFMLVEAGGAQYYASPPPPPTETWKSIVIPFSRFKHGTWTRDANGKLDLDDVRKVCVGAHGVASGKGGSGQIWTVSVEAVPTLEPAGK
ncbi:MAG: hypothetical protein GXP31_03535 [Kiritimatiellaeota bacterium]|nr:hypothetical protein [Kiritimatiellota bacterium]